MSTNLALVSPIGPELRPEWLMRLVMDVALGTTTESILEAHDLQHHQFEKILENPQFVMQVADLRTQLEKDGATFKLKAQLQADFYLTKVHEMIKETDLYMLPDYPNVPHGIAEYRQALRDITDQPGFPHSIQLPVLPVSVPVSG